MGCQRRVAFWYFFWVVFALATGATNTNHATALASCPSTASADSSTLGSYVSNGACALDSSQLIEAESVIREFLKENCSPEKRFRVQGWRWHSMSLIRDAKRLGTLASRLSQKSSPVDISTLDKAAYHVVDFNMKALHRVENKLFFPWLRDKLSDVDDTKLAQGFLTVLDQVIADQRVAEQIGFAVTEQSAVACNPSATNEERQNAIRLVRQLANDLSSRVSNILKREDSFLVPAVSVLVSDAEQRSFNNKVIRNLGILDSRLHLVGMFEAVQEKDATEQRLFQEEIPSVSRFMIPRWKRTLYDPQAGMLDDTQ